MPAGYSRYDASLTSLSLGPPHFVRQLPAGSQGGLAERPPSRSGAIRTLPRTVSHPRSWIARPVESNSVISSWPPRRSPGPQKRPLGRYVSASSRSPTASCSAALKRQEGRAMVMRMTVSSPAAPPATSFCGSAAAASARRLNDRLAPRRARHRRRRALRLILAGRTRRPRGRPPPPRGPRQASALPSL